MALPRRGVQDWGEESIWETRVFLSSVFFFEITSQLMSTGPGTPVVLGEEMVDIRAVCQLRAGGALSVDESLRWT